MKDKPSFITNGTMYVHDVRVGDLTGEVGKTVTHRWGTLIKQGEETAAAAYLVGVQHGILHEKLKP